MNRLHRLFALTAIVAVLANQGCSSSSRSSSSPPPPNLSLRFDFQPASGLPGEAMAVKVSLRDASGALAQAGGDVTIGLGAASSPAALQGTTTRAAVNGVATFDDLVIAAAGPGYTLAASSPGAAAAASDPFALAWSVDEGEAPGASSNDTPAGAEPILVNVPLFGSLSSPDDVDWFKFHAQAGQILSVSSYATRLDLDSWDTSLRLRLVAPDGTTELQRIGVAETGFNSVDHGFPAVRIPVDGDYYVACDVDASGLQSGKYALLVKLAPAPAGLQLEAEGAGQVGQNDSRASAQSLAPGLLYGQYQTPGAAAGSDFYKLTLDAATRVHLALVAGRNGVAADGAAWDALLELQDSTGRVLWSNDDTDFFDPEIDYVVTLPGDYYVRVTRAAAADTGSAPYLLSYEASPYTPAETAGNAATAAGAMPIGYGQYVGGAFAAPGDQYFAFGGEAGDLVRLWVEDETHLQGSSLNLDPGSTADAVFLAGDGVTPLAIGSSFLSTPPAASEMNVRQTILQASGTTFVRVRSDAAGRFGLRLERVAAAAYESEPNDAFAQANPVGPGGWVSGAIGAAGDTDHYAVHAEAGQLVTVSLLAAPGGNDAGPYGDWGSALVPTVEVLDAQGHLLSATSADRLGAANFAESVLRPDPMIETSFRAPAAGDYDVVVSDANAAGGPTFFYALHVWKNQ